MFKLSPFQLLSEDREKLKIQYLQEVADICGKHRNILRISTANAGCLLGKAERSRYYSAYETRAEHLLPPRLASMPQQRRRRGWRRMKSWIIGYDITDPRRLARVHRAMVDRAMPIEYSVFLFFGTQCALDECLAAVAGLIDSGTDDVRCYPLPQRGLQALPCRTASSGRACPPDRWPRAIVDDMMFACRGHAALSMRETCLF